MREWFACAIAAVINGIVLNFFGAPSWAIYGLAYLSFVGFRILGRLPRA